MSKAISPSFSSQEVSSSRFLNTDENDNNGKDATGLKFKKAEPPAESPFDAEDVGHSRHPDHFTSSPHSNSEVKGHIPGNYNVRGHIPGNED
jgi:hypothetical protein